MIRIERLLLRPWCEEDYQPYAVLNADPKVRRWWSAGTLTTAESNAQADRLRRHVDDHGFGFWAVEVPGVSPFIGFIGLMHVDDLYSFAPGGGGWLASGARMLGPGLRDRRRKGGAR